MPHANEPTAGEIDADSVRALAEALGEHHRTRARGGGGDDLDPAAETRELASRGARIRQRFPDLDPAASDALAQVERELETFLERHADRLRQRAADGRRSAELGPPLRLADCRLRDRPSIARRPETRSVASVRDVAVDLASLAADLAAAGRADLAERLLSGYAAATGDIEIYGVVDHYQRACTLARAADSENAEQARRWLLQARATRRPRLLPPMLVGVGGLVASGKSTIARMVAERMAAPRLEADRVAADLSESDPKRPLSEDFEPLVYGELLRRARVVLDSGRPVVLDACFPRRKERLGGRQLAGSCGLPFLFVECRVDATTAGARLDGRDDPGHEGDWRKLHHDLADRWEPVDELPADEHLALDCTLPLEACEQRLLARIPGAPSGHPIP